MAYQDRRHHSDPDDSGRRRRDGDRHGFGRRKHFEGSDDRPRSGHNSRRDDESYHAQRRSQRPSREEHGSHGERRHHDDWRGERHHDGDSAERRFGRSSGRPGRFSDSSGRRESRDRRDDRRGRPPQRQRAPEPDVPDDVEPGNLERGARSELRTLGRANAENVARHLVMAQRLLNDAPQTAYEHARYAASHAGRVAVVRETAGIAAYLAGHYNEALREIRAARRLSGLDLHRAIEVDCERALGHADKALQAAKAADPRQLDEIERSELAMVVSSLRHEMGQTELGLIVIEDAIRARPSDSDTLRRLHSVRADRLEELGRHQEAAAVRDRIGLEPSEEDEVEVFDIEDDYDSEPHDLEEQDAEEEADPERDDGAGGPVETSEAPDASGESDADDATILEPVDQDDDVEWSASFAERVEAEMAELLQDTDKAPATPSTDEATGSSSTSPDDTADGTTPTTISADDTPEELR